MRNKIVFLQSAKGYQCGIVGQFETIVGEGKTKGSAAIRFIQQLNKSTEYFITHKSKIIDL